MLRIYHNNRCRKSREGLAFLNDLGQAFETVEYLKEGLTESDLEDILKKLNVSVEDILRTQEAYYKKELKGKKFTKKEWIKIIIETPTLLKRPLVLSNTKGVFAVPPEEINKIV